MFTKRLLPLLLAAMAGLGAASAARAQINPEFARSLIGREAGESGGSACFVRRYDNAHLSAHPLQKVTQMSFLVRLNGLKEEGGGAYSFVVGVTQRGRKGLFSGSGGCGQARAQEGEGPVTHMHCGIDCDGGGVDLEVVNGGRSVRVKINDYVALEKPESKPDDEPDRERLRAGADDKVFRLDRVSIEECAGLFSNRGAFTDYLTEK